MPDPGFERVRTLPSKNGNGITCTKNWLCPMGTGSSDYYHKDGTRHAGVPKNVFGRQKPHSGKAYGGMCIRKKFMEYVETKLTDTLIAGRDYLVEFYISRAEKSIGAVKEFGVLFTKKKIMGVGEVGLAVEPSVDFIKRSGYRKKKKWMKFSAVYHAQGDEAVLTLGHFNYKKGKRFKGFAHYYVDDVTVTLIEEKTDSLITNKTEEPVTETIPKPFSPKAGELITLKNIFFVTNKSELLPGSFAELDKLALYLSETPEASIQINGHTDKTGSEEKNKLLSEARAKAVADYLSSKEIDSSRISYTGYGSSKPIAANDTEEGKQQNRRVEFIISN